MPHFFVLKDTNPPSSEKEVRRKRAIKLRKILGKNIHPELLNPSEEGVGMAWLLGGPQFWNFRLVSDTNDEVYGAILRDAKSILK
jgi:hypothetical protein